jgi:2-dehydro-3-deoxy-D-arabinonate dehydratase
MIKLCRYQMGASEARVGWITESDRLLDLSEAGVPSITSLLEAVDLPERLQRLAKEKLASRALKDVRLLSPVERQEVWAAGVTYLRSKKARMEESDFSATAYDRVYEAARPEIFFKSMPGKVSGPGDPVGIRKDATWNVPEPELVLAINASGKVVGYSIGNDMSSRDIEGENLLYLPQAKVYDRSCALGPCIVLDVTESQAREWSIQLRIERDGNAVFEGETSVNQIKRSFDELAGYLCRSQTFPDGAMLLTGTGVVPGEDFTLHAGDRVRIEISGIGVLENPVAVV